MSKERKLININSDEIRPVKVFAITNFHFDGGVYVTAHGESFYIGISFFDSPHLWEEISENLFAELLQHGAD